MPLQTKLNKLCKDEYTMFILYHVGIQLVATDRDSILAIPILASLMG